MQEIPSDGGGLITAASVNSTVVTACTAGNVNIYRPAADRHTSLYPWMSLVQQLQLSTGFVPRVVNPVSCLTLMIFSIAEAIVMQELLSTAEMMTLGTSEGDILVLHELLEFERPASRHSESREVREHVAKMVESQRTEAARSGMEDLPIMEKIMEHERVRHLMRPKSSGGQTISRRASTSSKRQSASSVRGSARSLGPSSTHHDVCDSESKTCDVREK